MKNAPYTIIEAENLYNQFQYLVGQKFDKDTDALIDCVAIAPFDEINKNRFTIFYLLFDDAGMALNHEYTGTLYDVLVISGGGDEEELQSKGLHEWCLQNDCISRAEKQNEQILSVNAMPR